MRSASRAEVRVREVARRLGALERGAIRVRAAARLLASEPPADAAALVAAALERAAGGDALVADALGAALLAPGPELTYERVAAIYAAAAEDGLEAVRYLLASAPPRRPYEPPRGGADAGLADVPLGRKKTLARTGRDPDALARLAAEGDPAVVRELLRNPLLTEELVVRIAARRPCRPETLRCIADDRRWRVRRAVARAIALNPFAEPELVSKLLASLGRSDLADIAGDAALHANVRALASRLSSEKRGAPSTSTARTPGRRGPGPRR